MKNIMKKYPLVFVFAFLTLCLLPLMAMRDFSPSNELRYLSIADEAIRNGSVFAFYNHGLVYADKPPLYLWIIILLRLIFGEHSMLALYAVSWICSIVVACVMDRWVAPKRPLTRAALALMLFSSVMYIGSAVIVRMDMMMCMFITLALYSFYKLYTGQGNGRVQSILLPVFIFLALFTKGPVGLLLPPLSILAFLIVRGKWREAGKYLGWKTWGIIALLSAVWLVFAYAEGGGEYLHNLLFHQTVNRAVNAFTHKEPVWYYIVMIWVVAAPCCLLTVGAVVASLWSLPAHSGAMHISFRKASAGSGAMCASSREVSAGYDAGFEGAESGVHKNSGLEGAKSVVMRECAGSRSDMEVLFVTVILTTVVMLSCFSSKLSVYLLPALPFLVYLLPVLLESMGWKKWMTVALAIPAGLFALTALAGFIALTFFHGGAIWAEVTDTYSFIGSSLVKLSLLLLLVCNVVALLCLLRRKAWETAVLCLCGSIFLFVFPVSLLMPQINDWVGYANVCKLVPDDCSEVNVLYLHRPENMSVYLGQEVSDFQKDTDAFLATLPGTADISIDNVAAEDAVAEPAAASATSWVATADNLVAGKPAAKDFAPAFEGDFSEEASAPALSSIRAGQEVRAARALIVKTDSISCSAGLEAFVSSHSHVTSGPYSVVLY